MKSPDCFLAQNIAAVAAGAIRGSSGPAVSPAAGDEDFELGALCVRDFIGERAMFPPTPKKGFIQHRSSDGVWSLVPKQEAAAGSPPPLAIEEAAALRGPPLVGRKITFEPLQMGKRKRDP